MSTPVDPAWQSYLDTKYEAHLPPPVRKLTLKVGALHPALDTFLTGQGGNGNWVFITAWNPGQERPGAEANAKANGKLRQRLEQLGLPFWNAVGICDDGKHSELSFFVSRCDRALALQLGKEFRQSAVLIGAAGQKAELLDCR